MSCSNSYAARKVVEEMLEKADEWLVSGEDKITQGSLEPLSLTTK